MPPEAWKHQKDALEYTISHPQSLLAMGMGTGKSRVIVDLIDKLQAKRTLIVCPKSVLLVWPRQFEIHASQPVAVEILKGPSVAAKTSQCKQMLDWASQTDSRLALVVNYDSAWREPLGPVLLKTPWNLVVLDESHRIKAPGSKVSWFFKALGKLNVRKCCLTGTPMPNSPLDIYGQYRFLDSRIFGTSFALMRNNYAVMGGFENRQVVSFKNKADFHRRYASIAFQVSRDVLDLPAEVHIERPFELSASARKIYRELEEEFISEVDSGIVTVSNALVKLLRLQQITSGWLSDDEGNPNRVDRGKAEVLEDVLEDLEPRESVVVFCRFRRDLDAVREIAGSMDPPRKTLELSGRVNELAEWQAGGGDVLAVQIQAGGVGIDLTRARYCVFYSIGFSLGDYEQACARVHRPGQTRSVSFIHLLALDTVDQKVYDALSRKRSVIEEILSGITRRRRRDGIREAQAVRGACETQA